jgi:hypothetical protein
MAGESMRLKWWSEGQEFAVGSLAIKAHIRARFQQDVSRLINQSTGIIF